MDPFEDFEFKPLTEGLGFHKKAEKIKTDIKSVNLGQDKTARTVPDVPPRSLLHPTASELGQPLGRESRPATQSISDLMASLPPSLDFLDDKEDPLKSSRSSSASAKTPKFELGESFKESYSEPPQIFQPLGRDDYNLSPSASATSSLGASMGSSIGGAAGSPVTSSMNAALGTTLGSVLPAPGSKAGGLPGPISTGASVPAPTIGRGAPSPYRERLDESFARAFPHAEKSAKKETAAADEAGLEPIPTSIAAAFLDGMVAAGVGMITLVVILAITRINLMGLLSNAQTDGPTQLHLGLLFAAVLQLYMMIARSAFGATLGEWAFDLQAGTTAQQKSGWYPLQVAWRAIIMTVTGLVVLPILSLIVRRDLGRYLTGLQLYRRV